MPALDIRHNAETSRFEAWVEGGVAECTYRLRGPVMDIVYTEVPPVCQGRGIAAALVQATLDHARANGYKVRPLCGYVRTYMRRHADTLDLLESA